MKQLYKSLPAHEIALYVVGVAAIPVIYCTMCVWG